jgi:hypothetical protein
MGLAVGLSTGLNAEVWLLRDMAMSAMNGSSETISGSQESSS